MRKHLSRIVITVCFVILAVYFIMPTVKDYNYKKELSSLTGADSLSYLEKNGEDMKNAKLKRMKLGLDLQGGMRVVLEVDVIQLLIEMAKNKDDNFNQMIKEVREETSKSEISVVSSFVQKMQDRKISVKRYYGERRDEEDRVVSMLEDESSKAVDRAIEVIRNRIDQYGVSEPNIQKQGGRRIIVELPGVKDEAEVRQLLHGTALLEFRLVKDKDIAYKVMQTIDKYVTGNFEVDTTNKDKKSVATEKTQSESKSALSELTGGAIASESDTTRDAQFAREHPFFYYVKIYEASPGDGYVEAKNKERVAKLLEREDIKKLLPQDFEFLWSAKPEKLGDGKEYYILHAVKKSSELTGSVIVDAKHTINQEDSRPIVTMKMSSEGAHEWARITGANLKKRIAIVLDKVVFSAPTVQAKITGGNSQISGMGDVQEARMLEIVLKAGALPAPVYTIEQRSVGASLGEDSIRSGLNSTIIAVILTILFMVVYYRSAGFVADFALLFNILFILGAMAAFQATLTLPGIAGIVLTIGMAVDANVLINERIREELRGGKTLRASIDAGYQKAFTAIIDSNITTFLTGIVLYQFGSGPVQGFALTLMFGILASMFSAIVITHVIFNILTEKGLNPNFG